MANDANIIKIKRSGTAGAPSSLKLGELAYSYLASTGNPDNNGGDRLFIGANGVNGGTGNANDVIVIGGKYFTDLLDHERGVLTASSALIVGSDKKLDELLVDDLSLNGATLGSTADLKINTVAGIELNGTVNKISSGPYGGTSLDFQSYELILRQDRGGGISLKVGDSGSVTSTFSFNNDGSLTVPGTIKTLSNGDLILAPNGTGKVQINTGASSFTLPASRTTTTGYVLTANTDGTTSWAASASAFSLKAGTGGDNLGTDATIDLLTDSLELRGEGAISTDLTKTTIGSNDFYVSKIKARLATTSNTGVASFSSDYFSVNITGAVSLKDGGVTNAKLEHSSFYIGTTNITLGDASGHTTSLAVDISGNAATVTNGIYTSDEGTVTNVMLANSTISGISLGNSLNDLTVGTNLSLDSGTTYNGGSAKTISLTSTLTDITSISAASGNSVTLNNGTDNLVFDSTGQLVLPKFTFPNASGTAGQVLVWTGAGASSVLSWSDISTTLDFTGDNEGAGTVDLLNNTFVISGGTNITTSASGQTLTIDLDSSLTGVSIDGSAGSVANALTFSDTGGVALNATFDGSAAKTIDYSSVGAAPKAGSSDITTVGTLTSGSIGTGFTAIPNSALSNSTIEVNGTSFTLGDTGGTITANTTNALANGSNIQTFSFDGSTSGVTVALATTLTGLTEVNVGDLKLSGSTIENTATSSGSVDIVVSDGATEKTWTFESTGNLEAPTGARITGLTDPVDAQDAATRHYVDTVAQGLHTHQAVRLATTDTLASITSDTATYDNGPLDDGDGATITLATALTTLDGFGTATGNRILVKNEGDAGGLGSFANGIYTINSAKTILTRADDFKTIAEIAGGDFVFIQTGTLYGDTGWVQTAETTAIGSGHPITWAQFSGAGTYLGGDGLTLTGNSFSVNVNDTTGGIELYNDKVQLKSGVAGDGLTYTDGVIAVAGTTDRITVSANAIDISTSYVGQNTITTLGTITTGTWSASTIASNRGGTGFTTYAKGDILYASAANTLSKLTAGTNGQMLQLQDGVPVWADLDGGTYGP